MKESSSLQQPIGPTFWIRHCCDLDDSVVTIVVPLPDVRGREGILSVPCPQDTAFRGCRYFRDCAKHSGVSPVRIWRTW
jgi:hypothetical protein